MKEWDAEEALQNLTAERMLDDGDDLAASERIFAENAVGASLSIVHIALYSSNERLRLDASRYIVDRNLGRIGDTDPLKAIGNDPLFKFMKAVSSSSFTDN
jgi:hypothetical protein